ANPMTFCGGCPSSGLVASAGVLVSAAPSAPLSGPLSGPLFGSPSPHPTSTRAATANTAARRVAARPVAAGRVTARRVERAGKRVLLGVDPRHRDARGRGDVETGPRMHRGAFIPLSSPAQAAAAGAQAAGVGWFSGAGLRSRN